MPHHNGGLTKEMRPRVKKIIIGVLDVILGAYLVLAVTSFNKPKVDHGVCSKVEISVADSSDAGFLSAAEIKQLLQSKGLYPLGKKMDSINPRTLEEAMAPKEGGSGIPFVKTAECYKTNDGHVCITITQRTPLIRVKSIRGDDYYLDDHGGIMPNSKYTSDLPVVTGYVSSSFAKFYITPLARAIMANDFWRNQIEQINVLPDLGIEFVPRVGNHIIYIGKLPQGRYWSQVNKEVTDYVNSKLERTLTFYKYGLNVVGWNKYSYIDVEFDNQIVCRKRDKSSEPSAEEQQQEKKEENKEIKQKDSVHKNNDSIAAHELEG